MLFLPVKLIQAGESGASGMLRKRCKLVSLEHHGRLNVAESVIFKISLEEDMSLDMFRRLMGRNV